MNPPEFDQFTNHWAGCAKCHPMHDIYCATGRDLWMDEKAGFIATLETIKERQYWLGLVAKNSPQYVEQIRKLVTQKFKVIKNAK